MIIDTGTERFYEVEVCRLRGIFLLHPAALNLQQAETCLQRAGVIAARQHAKAWELRSAVSLSRLWHQQGKPLDARQKLEPIYGWFTEGFTTPDLLEARALLDILVQ
jgi:predicted ATPase